MPTTRRTITTLALLALPVSLFGCAGSGSAGTSGGVTGSAILTLEDDHGSADTRETLTMLQLPLPGLGARPTAVVEWSQIETRATANWATSPVALDAENNLAIIAGETGITLVSTDGRIEHIAEITTHHAISSVSLASNGLGVALSADGETLHVFTATLDGLTHEGEFPLSIALGDGSRAVAALLNQDGVLAVLDAGRSRIAMLSAARTADGIELEKQWERRTGDGLVSGTWTPDGETLIVAQRMLAGELEDRVEIVSASGRLSFYPSSGADSTHAMLPGLPSSVAVDRRGERVAVVMDRPEGSALALVAAARGGAALLDWATLGAHAEGVAFDARGRNILVAMPELGALAVWAIDGAMLRDTETLVDTGPGVSAVAVAGD